MNNIFEINYTKCVEPVYGEKEIFIRIMKLREIFLKSMNIL